LHFSESLFESFTILYKDFAGNELVKESKRISFEAGELANNIALLLSNSLGYKLSLHFFPSLFIKFIN